MSTNNQLSIAEKQRKTQTKILAFQAYQNQKIASKLDDVSSAVAQTNQLQSEIIKLQEENVEESKKQTVLLERQEKQAQLDRLEKSKTNLVKQAIFEVSEALEEIENNRTSSPTVKMAKLADVQQQVKVHDVSPSLVDAFEEKSFISTTLKKLQQMTDELQGDELKMFKAFEYAMASADPSLIEMPESEANLKKKQENARSFMAAAKDGNLDSHALEFIKNLHPKATEDKALFPPSGFGSFFMALVSIGIGLPTLSEGMLGFGFFWLAVAFIFVIRVLLLHTRRNSPERRERALEYLNTGVQDIEATLQAFQAQKEMAQKVNREIETLNEELEQLKKKYDDLSTFFPEPIEAIRYEDFVVIRSE